MVDHRVHIAGANRVEQARRSEGAPGIGALPVGLVEDGDLESSRLENAAKDRRGERRMVDVGVARHEDDVGLLPAALVHLRRRCRQKAEAGKSHGFEHSLQGQFDLSPERSGVRLSRLQRRLIDGDCDVVSTRSR